MEAVITRLSKELNLPPDVIHKIYNAYWLFIKEIIESLPLKDDMNEEAFSKLKPNFNIPNLGKLTCTYNRYVGIKKQRKLLKNKNVEYKENKTNG